MCVLPDGGTVGDRGRRRRRTVRDVTIQQAAPDTESSTALPLGVHAVAEARRFVGGRLAHWSVGDDVTAAGLLVVSELVTNAVLYGHGAGTLLVRRDRDARPGRILVEVSDRSRALPQPRDADEDSEIGRGLHIVEACSLEWGVRPDGDGKVVWAALADASVPGVARDLVRERL